MWHARYFNIVVTLTISFLFLSTLSCQTQDPLKQSINKELENLFSQRAAIKDQCKNLDSAQLEKALFTTDMALPDTEQPSWFLQNVRSFFVKATSLLSRISLTGEPFNYKKLIRITSYNAPTLDGVLHDLTSKLSMPKPLFFIVDDENFINAMALSINHKVAVVLLGKRPALNFSYRSLKSTLAHELGHIKKHHLLKRAALLATLIISLNFLTDTAKNYFIPSENPLIDVGVFFGSLLASLHLAGRYFRYTEKEADDIELSVTHDPDALDESLKELQFMDCQHFYKQVHARHQLCTYVDAQFGIRNRREAQMLKRKFSNRSANIFEKIIALLFSIRTHPSDEERGNNAHQST